jgi:hypothetical protein
LICEGRRVRFQWFRDALPEKEHLLVAILPSNRVANQTFVKDRTNAQRKQAQTDGGDGFPAKWQWLQDAGLKPGEFQAETKPRLRHAMKNGQWQEKPRVWACLSLASMGNNSELAIIWDHKLNAFRPITQADIAKQTGIPVRNVHRCIIDLESEGSLKRIPVEGGKGEYHIHCYAVPIAPKKRKVSLDNPAEPKSEYDGLPEDLAYWLRHLKLHTPNPEKIQEARELCAALT